MRRYVLALAGCALFAAPGCFGSTGGVLTMDFNGKIIEVHSATELRIPRGNESQLRLREWTMNVAGQEPIAVIAGGQEHTLYTTDTTIQVDGRAVDLMQGEKIVITPEGVTLPSGPAPAAEDKPKGDGDKK